MTCENKMTLVLEKEFKMKGLFCNKVLAYALVAITLHGGCVGIPSFIRIWNTVSLETKIFRFKEGEVILDILKLEDGICALLFRSGRVALWDLYLEEEILSLEGHTRGVNFITNIEDGYLTTSQDNTIKIWKSNTQTTLASEVFSLETKEEFTTATILPDKRIILGSRYGRLFVLNTETRDIVRIGDHSSQVMHLHLLSEDKLLSQSYQGQVRIWDIKTWKYTSLFDGFSSDITNCFDILEIANLPPDIIREIEDEGKLYSLGERYLLYIKDTLPIARIVNVEKKKLTQITLPQRCASVVDGVIVVGCTDSLRLYSLLVSEK